MALPRILAGAAALCVAAVCVTAVPAAAAMPSTLSLTATTRGQAPHVVELTCDPVAGTHPDAQLACLQLDQVDGDIANMPGTEAHIFCPMIFQPIKVSATGLWRGRTVLFQDSYTNSCERDNKTGSLFRF
ncbi:SSI family serine proteinase inhibitor [Kutzneria sp. 744]|uniref:SSI family serine proteinase inhibitor n=1 Tax=Kutzneria sp. (strain 744) TaxID=345341 RepID=UPI0003EEB56E|nr:SSI family serine proteinase inhibitor [Kutzneria sp. 744]EWM15963.1 serine protease inhibitor [Kutzneria sp. 744]